MAPLLSAVALAGALLAGCGDGGTTRADRSGPTNAANQQSAAESAAGKIAFVSGRKGSSEIFVMNADGTGVTQLTNDPGPDLGPAWSPDGTKIAFASTRNTDAFNDEIFVMSADGSGVTQLTNDADADFAPAWSPDGTKIAFVRDETYGGFARRRLIFVMNADGTGVTELTPTNDPGGDIHFPVWSPDGTKIAFVSGFHVDIFVMNADGTGVTQLTNNPRADSWPVWSPDGTKIAFWSTRANLAGDIFVMNADGTGLTNLTPGPGSGAQPAWSPTGAPSPS